MDDGGRLVKMEVDYSNTVDKTLPECQEIAKVSSVFFIIYYLSFLVLLGR